MSEIKIARKDEKKLIKFDKKCFYVNYIIHRDQSLFYNLNFYLRYNCYHIKNIRQV